MPLCQGCRQFVFAATTVCPHCGVNVSQADAAHDRALSEAWAACDDLQAAIARSGYQPAAADAGWERGAETPDTTVDVTKSR